MSQPIGCYAQHAGGASSRRTHCAHAWAGSPAQRRPAPGRCSTARWRCGRARAAPARSAAAASCCSRGPGRVGQEVSRWGEEVSLTIRHGLRLWLQQPVLFSRQHHSPRRPGMQRLRMRAGQQPPARTCGGCPYRGAAAGRKRWRGPTCCAPPAAGPLEPPCSSATAQEATAWQGCRAFAQKRQPGYMPAGKPHVQQPCCCEA